MVSQDFIPTPSPRPPEKTREREKEEEKDTAKKAKAKNNNKNPNNTETGHFAAEPAHCTAKAANPLDLSHIALCELLSRHRTEDKIPFYTSLPTLRYTYTQ